MVRKVTHLISSKDKRTAHVIDSIQPDPLADPIITAIFDNVANSGEATLSLSNAVLADLGREPVGKILEVTPQRIHPAIGLDGRSFRLDIEAITSTGEFIHIEVQLSKFYKMTERNLLYCLTNFSSNAKCGDELTAFVKRIPRVYRD
jgi:hypothetical protein